MKPEIKQQWIEALRSGEYEQGKDFLRTDNNKFCCLGVLTDLAVKAGVLPQGELEAPGCFDDPEKTVYTYKDVLKDSTHDNNGTLPDQVMNWCGMETHNGVFTPTNSTYSTSLVELNDGGASFQDIALVIESKF